MRGRNERGKAWRPLPCSSPTTATGQAAPVTLRGVGENACRSARRRRFRRGVGAWGGATDGAAYPLPRGVRVRWRAGP
ncbi:hypothetical protein ATSB10_27830 [Dyella thiooxydans]|uniref:Uncharacterized protein n=1 Tax=Dyella thiooxydans TaxID=445710 RepID=A0A160N3G3_9GAMM|nr:hypothetical protein ATSB10_27830 [Dyella thiooxydans]